MKGTYKEYHERTSELSELHAYYLRLSTLIRREPMKKYIKKHGYYITANIYDNYYFVLDTWNSCLEVVENIEPIFPNVYNILNPRYCFAIKGKRISSLHISFGGTSGNLDAIKYWLGVYQGTRKHI